MNREEMEKETMKRIHEEHSEKAVGLAASAFLGSLIVVVTLFFMI